MGFHGIRVLYVSRSITKRASGPRGASYASEGEREVIPRGPAHGRESPIPPHLLLDPSLQEMCFRDVRHRLSFLGASSYLRSDLSRFHL